MQIKEESKLKKEKVFVLYCFLFRALPFVSISKSTLIQLAMRPCFRECSRTRRPFPAVAKARGRISAPGGHRRGGDPPAGHIAHSGPGPSAAPRQGAPPVLPDGTQAPLARRGPRGRATLVGDTPAGLTPSPFQAAGVGEQRLGQR